MFSIVTKTTSLAHRDGKRFCDPQLACWLAHRDAAGTWNLVTQVNCLTDGECDDLAHHLTTSIPSASTTQGCWDVVMGQREGSRIDSLGVASGLDHTLAEAIAVWLALKGRNVLVR